MMVWIYRLSLNQFIVDAKLSFANIISNFRLASPYRDTYSLKKFPGG